MPTILHTNGSRCAGRSPAPLAALLALLASDAVLDSYWERTTGFAQDVPCRTFGAGERVTTRFLGNFLGVSHAFDITSDDDAVCTVLFAALRDHLSGTAYREARAAAFRGPGRWPPPSRRSPRSA